MRTHNWDDVLQRRLDTMTPEQRQTFEDYDAEAEAQIRVAELVYEMRLKAGLTQTELARRIGTKQPYVSAVEAGGQSLTIATLIKLAKATGNRVVISAVPA